MLISKWDNKDSTKKNKMNKYIKENQTSVLKNLDEKLAY